MTTTTRPLHRGLLALVAASSLLTVGCTAEFTASPHSGPVSSTPDVQVTRTVDGELSREILPDVATLVKSLKQNGGSIVVGVVTRSVEAPGSAQPNGIPIRAGQDGYLPATDSTVRVLRQIGGVKPVSDEIALHQLLAPDSEYAGLPKLRVGSTYLMAIRPFTFGRLDQLDGHYVVAGYEAAWKQIDADTFEWIGRGLDSGTSYAASLTQNEAVALFATV